MWRILSISHYFPNKYGSLAEQSSFRLEWDSWFILHFVYINPIFDTYRLFDTRVTTLSCCWKYPLWDASYDYTVVGELCMIWDNKILPNHNTIPRRCLPKEYHSIAYPKNNSFSGLLLVHLLWIHGNIALCCKCQASIYHIYLQRNSHFSLNIIAETKSS